MILVGKAIIYVIMACALAGCLASVFRRESELGKQFLLGVETLGTLFIPVAGVMASMPFLKVFIVRCFGPLFSLLGADPAMAATTFIASDMGGYQLASAVAKSPEGLVVAFFNGLMAGATIVFSFPIALKMLPKSEHAPLAEGMLFGFLSVPVGVFVSSLLTMLSKAKVRETLATSGEPMYVPSFSIRMILLDILPLCIFCALLAFVLIRFPKGTVKVFSTFGDVLDGVLRIVFVLCVIQYFTGVFPAWEFDPIMADDKDSNRALEMCGYIAIMLCGAYPMVYLLQKYLEKPLGRMGKKMGLSTEAMAAMLASLANSIALFSMVGKMDERNKVRVVAFSVGASFVLGDHLAFAATWQPSLIMPMIVGKLVSGFLALYLADIPFRKKKEATALR
jgi:ethanolamine transporter